MRRSRFNCTSDHATTPRRRCADCAAAWARERYRRNRAAILARQKVRRSAAIIREVSA